MTSSAAARLLHTALDTGESADETCTRRGHGQVSAVKATSTSPALDPTTGAETVLAAAGIRFVSVVDTTDACGYDFDALVHTCIGAAEDEGVLVTHDLSTVVQAASDLEAALCSHHGGQKCTVVLTGARLPERFRGSDAALNVGVAMGALRSPSPLGPGVFIAAGTRVMTLAHAVQHGLGIAIE